MSQTSSSSPTALKQQQPSPQIFQKQKKETMHCTASKDMEVSVPASEIWQVLGMLKIEEFYTKYLTHIFSKSEVLEGDGRGVGSVFKLTFSPGNFEFSSQTERYTRVDMEKRVIEAEVIEGGYLDMGFNLFLFRAEVIESSEKSCLIRAMIEYEVNEGVDLNVALPGLQYLLNIAKVVASYALENQQT